MLFTFFVINCILISAANQDVRVNPVDCSSGYWDIIETIPPDLGLPFVGNASTFAGFEQVLNEAKKSVSIAALWAQIDPLPSYAVNQTNAFRGPLLNKTFVKLAENGLDMSLVTNDCTLPHAMFSCEDPELWQQHGTFDVSLVDWNHLLTDAWGVIHAKILVVDQLHAYSGSANLAWSSFSQTKELGLLLYNCPTLAVEYEKLNDMWSLAGEQRSIPSQWPSNLLPTFNSTNRAGVKIANAQGEIEYLEMYPCYSPTPFHYEPGDDCADVIVDLINAAQEFIQISLMDYSVITLYQKHGGFPEQYWDRFDVALRQAAFRGVQVQLIVSNWTMTFPDEVPCWKSLDQVENITVHQFRMPGKPGSKDLGRVNHDKYFVTDQAAYVGTSNWSGDYFKYFAGLGWTIERGEGSNTVANELDAAFKRDWDSDYVVPLYY